MKKKTAIKKSVIGLFAVCLVLGAWAEGPTVTGVTVRQRWPWSRLVDIDYTLECDDSAAEAADIALTAYNGSQVTPLTIPPASLSGDLFSVKRGSRRIVWDPTKTAYTRDPLMHFTVDLTARPVPLYLVLSLTNAVGTAPGVEYVYEADLTNGLWGAWVRDPVTNGATVIQSVIWTGVTTNGVYKTDKLVLRRIRSGTFKNLNAATVNLTKDFYAGVSELTQRQWELIASSPLASKPSNFTNLAYYATRPVETVSYNDVRGKTNDNPAINWPLTGSAVSSNSFIAKLRAKTGIDGFDLPTEAQWEYLCRAGTTTFFNDGNPDANAIAPNDKTNVWLNALGRYQYNGGWVDSWIFPPRDCTPSNATAIVGSFPPNAWGLYDTLGNVWELTLAWEGTLYAGTDPSGMTNGAFRIRRGGAWSSAPNLCTPAYRNGSYPDNALRDQGVRLVWTLP